MNALVILSVCVAASQAAVIAAPGAYPGYGLGYGLAPHGYGLAGLPYGLPAAGYGYAAPNLAYAPRVVAAAPAQVPAPVAAPVALPKTTVIANGVPVNPSTQFQAQDELRNFQYGYSNINSAKTESGNALTGVQGSYSYVDANGQLQTTNYIADHLGFRVQATNLPVAPVNTPAEYVLAAPAPVEKTPEVLAAEAEHFAAVEEAAARTKRSVVVPAATTAGIPIAAPYGLINAAPYGLINAAPYGLVAAAPRSKAFLNPTPYAVTAPSSAIIDSSNSPTDGTLTVIKANPGHAIFYRVD